MGAVVHLHSTFATALSCLTDVNPVDCVPPLTPYVVMRVGKVKLVSYVAPGDPKAGDLIRDLGGQYAAVLLANHGPVVTGKDIHSAVYAAEELEETAKLLVTLRGWLPGCSQMITWQNFECSSAGLTSPLGLRAAGNGYCSPTTSYVCPP